MPVLVTCKFDEDPIKIKALSTGQGQIWAFFFGIREQVTLKIDSPFWPDF